MNEGIDFPYLLQVTRPSPLPAVQDPETGVFTPHPPQVIYDGQADVQDAGEALPRGSTGQAVKDADATVFLKDEVAGLAIEPNDVATVFYPGGDRTAEGEVKFVRELDGVVLIKYR
jgi:hypothetical protein